MELLKIMIDAIDLLAKILGFVALYAIAIALTDWRKTANYERQLNKIQNGTKKK
jgi:hypothetical protein